VIQPGGLERTWSYDGTTNRLESETHPESGTTTYTYYTHAPEAEPAQATPLLRTKTDARGQTFTYSYDGNTRLTAIDAANADAHDVAILDYDDWDNRRRVRVGPAGAPRVETWFTYEDATRMTARTDALNGRTFTTGYHYDERDNLDEITYPSGRKVQYDFDNANRVAHVNGPANNPVWAHTFSYHVSGGLAGYTARNGQTTAITYEEGAGTRRRHWPRRVQSGPVDLTYGYDAAGNVGSIADGRGAGFNQGFGYDNVDRLTAVSDFGAQMFEYDPRGNRTRKNGVIHQYHATTDRLTSDGVTAFGYDDAGNMTTAGSATYTYTPYNLLETATVGGAPPTTYRYDADNQRRMREGPNGTEYFVAGPGLLPLAEYRESGGQAVLVREYLYAGTRLIASVEAASTVAFGEAIVAGQTVVKAEHLAELRREANNVRVVYGLPRATWVVDPGETAADLQGRLIRYQHVNELRAALTAIAPHNFGADLQAGNPILAAHFNAIRDRINALRAGGERYYHLDALGSVRAVADATGTTLRRHDYQPFGEEINPQAGSDARRFTEKERDTETGLDYFGARYYAQMVGRFGAIDPLMGADTALLDPQRWNRYSYVGNRPTRLIDPDGQGWLSSLVKLLVKGGDVAGTAAGVIEDASTLFSSNVNVNEGQRLLAAASLTSELLPVSGRDVRAAFQWAGRWAEGTLVLYKFDRIKSDDSLLNAGEFVLALPKRDTPFGQLRQNIEVLRDYMKLGRPIRDSHYDRKTRRLLGNDGFLKWEREYLQRNGWTFNYDSGFWEPSQ
jgi:RHS repeat-associated protein